MHSSRISGKWHKLEQWEVSNKCKEKLIYLAGHYVTGNCWPERLPHLLRDVKDLTLASPWIKETCFGQRGVIDDSEVHFHSKLHSIQAVYQHIQLVVSRDHNNWWQSVLFILMHRNHRIIESNKHRIIEWLGRGLKDQLAHGPEVGLCQVNIPCDLQLNQDVVATAHIASSLNLSAALGSVRSSNQRSY